MRLGETEVFSCVSNTYKLINKGKLNSRGEKNEEMKGRGRRIF